MFTREEIEAIISTWPEDLQMAAQIRATEVGYADTADYFAALHEKLGEDPGFKNFMQEREKLSVEEHQAEFMRQYFSN